MLDAKTEEIQFFWKDNIDYEFINNDYLGPSDTAIFLYYDRLLNDAVR